MNARLIDREALKRRQAIAEQERAGTAIGLELLRCREAGEEVNVSAVAERVGVTRVTVYAWLENARAHRRNNHQED